MSRAPVITNLVVSALVVGFVVLTDEFPLSALAVLAGAAGVLAPLLTSSPTSTAWWRSWVGAIVRTVLPFAAGLGAVGAGRAAIGDTAVVGVATVAVALVCGTLGAALGATARRAIASQRTDLGERDVAKRAVIRVGTSAVLLVTLPAGADHYLERRLVSGIRQCEEMAPFAAPAPRTLQRTLADGCAVWRRGELAAAPDPDVLPVNVHGKGGVSTEVAEDAESAAAYYRSLLGPPAVEEIAVLAVDIPGPVRGMAGPGYLLIDAEELHHPRDCAAFRASAGVRGRCGRWVVAHELAHQWFRWTAFDRGLMANAALVEGPSDYLAYRWWRETAGGPDSARLALELVGGRLDLARWFAENHSPEVTPEGMSDSEERALVYGRATAAWLAVEVAVGPERAAEALRTVFTAGRSSSHLDTVLEAVERSDPRAAEVLRAWWTSSPFELRDAEWSPWRL